VVVEDHELEPNDRAVLGDAPGSDDDVNLDGGANTDFKAILDCPDGSGSVAGGVGVDQEIVYRRGGLIPGRTRRREGECRNDGDERDNTGDMTWLKYRERCGEPFVT
jgi:hypothetical protein